MESAYFVDGDSEVRRDKSSVSLGGPPGSRARHARPSRVLRKVQGKSLSASIRTGLGFIRWEGGSCLATAVTAEIAAAKGLGVRQFDAAAYWGVLDSCCTELSHHEERISAGLSLPAEDSELQDAEGPGHKLAWTLTMMA